MKRCIISTILIILLFLQILIPVSAYTVGIISYSLPLNHIVSMQNATINGSILSLGAGSRVIYDTYIPFNSVSVAIYFSTSNAQLNVQLAHRSYAVSLSGKTSPYIINFDVTQHLGEKKIELMSDASLDISEIVFNKEDIAVARTGYQPSLTDYQRAIQTAVVIDTKASAVLVNGAKRYVNIDDATLKPKIIDGKAYLPTDTLARALGYYYENIPQKSYVLLRKDDTEISFNKVHSYEQKNNGIKETISNQCIYLEGKSYLPIRYLAEAVGKYVGYQDGYIIIDNKQSVKNIIETTAIFNYVKDTLVSFQEAKVAGSTYYVSASRGSDRYTGTYEMPYKTLQKAGLKAKAGDTVIIEGGIYRETLKVSNNGTAANPIIFQAAEGQNVVISANEQISGFVQSESPNVVTATVPWSLGRGRNQVFYKEEALTEARHPNKALDEYGNLDLSGSWLTKGNIVMTSSQSVATSDTVLNQPNNYWQGGTFVSLHSYAWTSGTANIESSVSGQLNLNDFSTHWWFDPAIQTNYNYGFISGHKNAIDTYGEWVMEADGLNYKMSIYMPKGESKDTLKLEVKKRQLVMDLSSNRYVQIKNINTIGGGIKMNDSEMCVINGGNIRYVSHFIDSKDNRDGYIDDCNSKNINGAPPRGEMGIYLGGSDNAIVNTKIDYSAAAGIYLVGKYSYIENNVLANCGYMGSNVSGIFLATEAWKNFDTPRGGYGIYGNTVYQCGRSSFNVSTYEPWVLSNMLPPFIPYEVAYNEFYDAGLNTRDTGIAYVWGAIQGIDTLKTRFHHNLVYSTQHDVNQLVGAIYHDNFVQMQETYDNVVFEESGNLTYLYDSPIYVQPASLYPQAFATVDEWNNNDLGIRSNGKESLTSSDYPNGKPFRTGATDGQKQYLSNYQVINSKNGNVVGVDGNTVLSDGVTIEDGKAVFSRDNEWIAFENVSFDSIENTLKLYYSGDCYNTNDQVEIVIGNNINSSIKYTKTLSTNSPYDKASNAITLTSIGKYYSTNVYVKMNSYKSAKISGISVSSGGMSNTQYAIHYNDLIYKSYSGNFDRTYSDSYLRPVSYNKVPGDTVHPIAENIGGGVTLRYKVVLTGEAHKLVFAASTEGIKSGNTMTVRVNSLSNAPLAITKINGANWNVYPVNAVNLREALPAGTYDIYLTFEDASKSSQLYWFGFQ